MGGKQQHEEEPGQELEKLEDENENRVADHEELGIRIVQELRLQRHPSKIREFLEDPNENNVNTSQRVPSSPVHRWVSYQKAQNTLQSK
jgi:hypothetical protein